MREKGKCAPIVNKSCQSVQKKTLQNSHIEAILASRQLIPAVGGKFFLKNGVLKHASKLTKRDLSTTATYPYQLGFSKGGLGPDCPRVAAPMGDAPDCYTFTYPSKSACLHVTVAVLETERM